MKRVHTLRFAWYLAAVGGLISAGCQATGPAPRPVTRWAADRQTLRDAEVVSPARITFFGDHPDAERVPYENRLLTNMARHTFAAVGRDFDPDLDPDGSTLAFASTRNSERPDIFLKRVEGFAVTQLTSDPADDIQPRFSPDGASVVFCSNRSGNWDVWLINRDGTGLTQLTRDRTDEIAPCWSPDGERVAFTLWGRRSHQWEIWELSIDRTGVRRFLCYGMFPDFSPDGKRIVFQRARQRGTRWFSVWAVDLVEGEARHPTELAYSDSLACIAPRWAGDGNTVVYCGVQRSRAVPEGPEPRAADLWVVDAQTGARMKITDGAAPAFNPAWDSHRRIYFVSARAGVENIWSIATDMPTYPVRRAVKTDAGLSRAVPNTPIEATGTRQPANRKGGTAGRRDQGRLSTDG